jgi:NAD(P)-dependent dehydrogenase (short-subunit alcohol dehydrogenase family)
MTKSAAFMLGRRVVVTGGANGIGAAVAQRLATLGAEGVVLDLPEALDGSAVDPPVGWHTVPIDVADEASTDAALATSAQLLSGLDVVVAAAGVVPAWQHPSELDLDDLDRVFAVNVRGVAATIKHALPFLRAGSAITVVASVNAWRGDPNLTSYVASKHAALGLVRSAAMALGSKGIRVNAVAPGPVATDALRGRIASRQERGGLTVDESLAASARSTALGRIATAADVANAVAFLCSDLSSGITGQLLNVDGGIQ